MYSSRRAFLQIGGTALVGSGLGGQTRAQTPGLPPAPTTRPNVAAIDRERILTAANEALSHPPLPVTSFPGKESPGTPNDFYSSAGSRRQTDALLDLTLLVPALAAAATLTREPQPELADRFTAHAAEHLQAWFVTPATRMTPELAYAEILTGNKPNPEGILEGTGLAEVAVAIPFLHLDPAPYKPWFAEYLTWLNESRQALLARDRKDHLGASWLLQMAACARLTGNDALMAELRHRFKTVTIRAQILATGFFPHDLTTPNPYRNSLFTLDLLGGAAVLLSTRFDSLWDHELQDGPGMRAAIARHVPYIEKRSSWPYPADLSHFNDLPCRRPSLLFAGRAYSRPEYAELWRSLTPAEPVAPELLRAFPIRQPLLWVTEPKRFIA